MRSRWDILSCTSVIAFTALPFSLHHQTRHSIFANDLRVPPPGFSIGSLLTNRPHSPDPDSLLHSLQRHLLLLSRQRNPSQHQAFLLPSPEPTQSLRTTAPTSTRFAVVVSLLQYAVEFRRGDSATVLLPASPQRRSERHGGGLLLPVRASYQRIAQRPELPREEEGGYVLV